MTKENSKKISFLKVSIFHDFRGWAFEKGKGGPNESKVTLFTIGTAFLASGLNVTINERNLMFERRNIKKNMNLGVPLKGSKRVLMGQKSYFCS